MKSPDVSGLVGLQRPETESRIFEGVEERGPERFLSVKIVAEGMDDRKDLDR